MSLSRANTVLSIWILLVGIASIGNTQYLTNQTKDDLLKNAAQVKELAESTRDQLKNDPKNKESNGTIAEQFGYIAEQVDSIVELIKPLSLDTIHIDNKFIIQSFFNQLKELRQLLGQLFDKYSPEASKDKELQNKIQKQQNIALDYQSQYGSEEPIANQFKSLYSRLLGIQQTFFIKYNEPSAIGSVHIKEVLDAIETEITQIAQQLKSLTEKYPKP